MQVDTQALGNFAEALAKEYLQSKGLTPLRQQYRLKTGEIDLIMQDNNEVVFIEVRYRQDTTFGEGFETITKSKRRKLIRAALYFQQCNPWTEQFPCRFDVVSISGSQLNPKITWIPNAFGVE